MDSIRRWGEACDWSGWDPYDGLNSPFAPVLTLGRPIGRRLLTQVVKTSPLNLRPLLRIRTERNAKGVALAASGYARLAAARADETASAAALQLVDWLQKAAIPTAHGIGWAYHFDVQTRFFRYSRREPNVVATSFGAQALLDVHDLLEVDEVRSTVLDVVSFLTETLFERSEPEHFRYLAGDTALVHNANLLACAVLVRAAASFGLPSLADAAAGPLRTTVAAQAADGSWPYAEGRHGAWTDNFHTGYVLEALATCQRRFPELVGTSLATGLTFWKHALFTADGAPKPTPAATLPVDSHSYAQAVETWLAAGQVAEAERVARRFMDEMLAPDGHVNFERRRLWTNRVAFVRWTTAPAYRALTGLLLARAQARDERSALHAHLG